MSEKNETTLQRKLPQRLTEKSARLALQSNVETHYMPLVLRKTTSKHIRGRRLTKQRLVRLERCKASRTPMEAMISETDRGKYLIYRARGSIEDSSWDSFSGLRASLPNVSMHLIAINRSSDSRPRTMVSSRMAEIVLFAGSFKTTYL